MRQRIREQASELAESYDDPLFIVVLEGARRFANAVFEQLDRPANTWSAMRLQSYEGTESSGRVEIVEDLDVDVRGRDVVVLEDIVDTGRTLRYLDGVLRERGARRVDVWTLLSKPSRRVVDVELRSIGFEIPDEFVIGYGMDLDGRYRELNYIAIWNEDAERQLVSTAARDGGEQRPADA